MGVVVIHAGLTLVERFVTAIRTRHLRIGDGDIARSIEILRKICPYIMN